ncbi:hypothetical protein B2J86_04500 [Acidovorax sp. SRB_14]|uniref:hypothetical protein n=1 Tax=Acidovorax sp. SRB_14 TaxID=1962699 RepID=UPI001EB8753E|nr:hypothetical protein [Acidovorax sp. SRB_14]NMM80199.1 hypothetical protein [Acidovorax sp. SRB_14]
MNENIVPGPRSAGPGSTVPYLPNPVPPASAVSWAAILAGAAGAAALSLILLILGVGLGLSAVSPWSGQGAAADTFGVATIVWISFTQLAAAGLGGYLAGRLRTRWAGLDTDEVYFRDTAHGFLAWAVATLVTAGLLTSAIGGIVHGSVQAGAQMASGAASAASSAAMPAVAAGAMKDGALPNQGYFVDALFRKNSEASSSAPDVVATVPTVEGSNNTPSATASALVSASVSAPGSPSASAEAGRIFANAMGKGTLPSGDAKYLGQLVAQRTGMPQADAENRVTQVFGQLQASAKEAETAARNAADKARKASAYSALWLFVSLLIGAFFASLAATFGGRQRDLF